MDAVLDDVFAEINDHAQFEGGLSQAGQYLRLKDAVVGRNSFAFDRDLPSCNQIDWKGRTKGEAFIGDRDAHLTVYRIIPLRQFPNQRFFIYAFEKPWSAKRSVDFDPAFNDMAADPVFV